jgi:hypothetical protein
MKELCDLPESSFEDVMKDINALTEQGIAVDFNGGNILLDGSRPRIIDVHCDTSEPYDPADNNLDQLKAVLLHPWLFVSWKLLHKKSVPEQIETLYRELEKAGDTETIAIMRTLEEKLESAAEAAGFPANKKEARRLAAKSPVVPKTLELIEAQLGTVSMDAHPEELNEMIRRIKSYNPGNAR